MIWGLEFRRVLFRSGHDLPLIRACGQHTSEPHNARMRGRSCPEAWVFLVPERVCPKVEANPHQSQSSSLRRGRLETWKERSEPSVLEPGESSVIHRQYG